MHLLPAECVRFYRKRNSIKMFASNGISDGLEVNGTFLFCDRFGVYV